MWFKNLMLELIFWIKMKIKKSFFMVLCICCDIGKNLCCKSFEGC